VRNTKWLKIKNFARLYYPHFTTFRNETWHITNFVMLFQSGNRFPLVIQNDWKLQISQGYIIRILQHFATKLWNITNFVIDKISSRHERADLLRSKFWLIGDWSNGVGWGLTYNFLCVEVCMDVVRNDHPSPLYTGCLKKRYGNSTGCRALQT
jgi:hypothetical protein